MPSHDGPTNQRIDAGLEPVHVSPLFPQVQERLLALIREGVSIQRAAALCEPPVAFKTVYQWISWGEEGTEPFATFVLHMQRSLGEFELRQLAVLRDQARGFSTTADGERVAARGKSDDAKWLLERKFPDEWGRRDTTQQSNGDGNKSVIVLSFAQHGGNEIEHRKGELTPGNVVETTVVEASVVDKPVEQPVEQGQ